MIAIRKDIPFSQVPVYEVPEYLDTLALSIPSNWGDLLIVNVYRNPRAQNNTINWETFFHSFSDHFPSIIIVGDFNCHHQSWGCDHSSPYGNKLFKAIEDATFNTLNDGSATRFTRINEGQKMGSDHFPISITFEISFSYYEFFSYKYNLKKVCWSFFHDALKEEEFNNEKPDGTLLSALQAYLNLFELIDNALHIAGPKIESRPKRDYPNSPPWWNEECIKYERLRRAKLGRYRQTRSCADGLATLSTEIHTSFAEDFYTAALFLDVEAAYDSVVPSILINDMREMGVPWKICRFFKNLVTERNVFFKVNGSNQGPYKFKRGLPQGCVSSPT
ncbi:uncharacterized protein LOC117183059 [Belonocnema kinseyi]|uniref:uncharacterized protein LOC117183059 n=1 Tax=Belonocnema kinseyi TaxID=2817044 RepID=UPI00143D2068|nr:uncharacterized protein LOC117183059 [Belonocnema kinseyi]